MFVCVCDLFLRCLLVLTCLTFAVFVAHVRLFGGGFICSKGAVSKMLTIGMHVFQEQWMLSVCTSTNIYLCGDRGVRGRFAFFGFFSFFSLPVPPKTPFRCNLALLFEQFPFLDFSKRRSGGSLHQFSTIFPKSQPNIHHFFQFLLLTACKNLPTNFPKTEKPKSNETNQNQPKTPSSGCSPPSCEVGATPRWRLAMALPPSTLGQLGSGHEPASVRKLQLASNFT